MTNTSPKCQKIYIFCEICRIINLYWAKVMFTYLIISRERYFQFQVLPHVRSANNLTAH